MKAQSRKCPLAQIVAACLMMGPLVTAVQAQNARAILQAAGIESGLAVHLGARDGVLESDLARTGRWLVHSLAMDEEARGQIVAKLSGEPLLGLVSAETWSFAPALPYADYTVNLLVADLDALGNRAPTRQEMLRVLAPGGACYARAGGSWQTTVKPWPEGMDDWTHWFHGPEGNVVSRDKLVRPSTSLKWIAGVQGQDLRIARGQLFSPLRNRQPRGLPDTVDLVARDAFNGVPSWRCDTGLVTGDRPHQFVAAAGLVFHFPRREPCFAVATDARTGKLVREYSKGLQRPLPEQMGRGGTRPGVSVQLVCGPTLIQGYGKQVVALDIATGEPRWRVELERELGALVASPDGRRVFVHEVEDWDRGWARWGKHQTVAVTGLLDGKLAWRNTELAGQEISDLIHSEGFLYVFDPTTNLGDDGDADLWKFAADSGKLLWSKKGPKHNYNIYLNNAVVRGSNILSWGSFNNLRSYSTSDGAEQNHTINGYNQRCTRMSATGDWLVFGLTTWVDREFNWTQMAAGRSDCAYPAFLAHGQTFFTYNLACSCINMLRGIVALAPEVPSPPVPDAQRRQALSGAAGLLTSFQSPPGDNLITAEWQPDPLLFYFLDQETAPVESHGLTLVANVHRHTLVAKRQGETVWTFTTGGRIYGSPAVVGDNCCVSSADGWIYCLDLASGKPRWRFLAAPRDRKVVAYGQLESAWPVYNVVLHEGAVCVAAGRHAELDGGIHLSGLDPATGELRWKTVLHTASARYAAGVKSPRGDLSLIREIASVTPINGGLKRADGRLFLLSPMLKKSGSSNSQWGYFENPPGEARGARQVREIEIRPAEWHDKTINPQELVPLPAKKK